MKVSYPAEKNTSLQNGFYPIGYYHCWHGGIHIEGVENKTPIKAIADGKIIAFRYNQELKKVKGKGGKEFFFSNNFVVIRHDYESSGKKKMTFYSLYQHLSFGSQQQKEESKPKEQNKENIYTVKIKVFKQESGVFSSDGKSFIPLYSQVQIQSKDEVQGIYQVAFEGKNVQIPQEKNQTKTLNESGRIVFWGDKRGDRGLLLYSQARSNTPTKGVIKDGEKVTILDKTEVQGKDKKHTWYKVGYQGKEGFILEEHLATKPSESKEAQKNDTGKTATEPNLLPKFLKSYSPKDEVVTCDIDVKAGELIGWVGKQGLFNNPNYVATHIEVFTPDDGKEFIENKQKQGDNEKFYFELKKGTELKSYLKLNFVSPPYHKGTRVKVISKTATYTKVQPIEEVFIKEVHRWTAFDDIVDGKAIEKRWLSPEKRKTFWIENEYVELAKGKKEYVFTSSLSHIYLTDPERETQTRSRGRVYEDKLAKNVTIDIRQCKEKVSYENAEWIYVKSHYYREGKTIYNQGWVEVPKEEERFSAYHWDKFGFKTYDAEANRMYPIKGVNSYEGTSEFIKKMIALIDTNQDGKIQNEELQACYNKPELSHIFSRMVCKHKSEWSYKWAKIKSDYEKFIKYHYPDAKQEYVDERLKEIKAKYDTLYDFWDKLNFKTDTFWYFEPFAWVEQMNRVFDGFCPDDCSQCFDYQDVVVNPRLNNQSDNVNKNRFQREKRYNKTYPYPRGYYHSGTDILASSGDEVCAMLCGEVYSVVNTFKPNEYKANSLGNYLVIKSKDKEDRVIYLQYCHLDEVLVKKGQKIRHGEIIGKAGSTGNAASVYDEKGKLIHGIYPQYRHIHIEAFLESYSKKNRIDPEQFMKTKFDETTKGNVIK